jgi:hypothetical protein
MLANDISHGHGWGADVCLLIAVICAFAAAVVYALAARPHRTTTDGRVVVPVALWAPVLTATALAFTALGLLIL